MVNIEKCNKCEHKTHNPSDVADDFCSFWYCSIRNIGECNKPKEEHQH